MQNTRFFLFNVGEAGRTKKGRKKRKKRRKNEEGRSRLATKRESWERDGHSEARERERQRRRPMELLVVGHSLLAVGLAVTHGHPLWR